LRAELGRLSDESHRTIDSADEMSENLRGISDRVDTLRSSWTGQAASAYLDVWNELQSDCQDMIADLRWIGESLAATAATYGHTDSSAADAIGEVL
jgi:WXG100 family type VII secretion target